MTILLFIKYPIAGFVKTRLAKDFTVNNATQLYTYFVEDIVQNLSEFSENLQIIYSPSNYKEQFKQWLGAKYKYFPQVGNDLGEIMYNASLATFKNDATAVMLFGGDSPDLPPEIIALGQKNLAKNNIVLGPSFDGGYYTIGIPKQLFCKELFMDIHWGSSSVFYETVKKTNALHLPYFELPQWYDIDDINDVQNLIKRNQSTRFGDSRSMTFLQTIKTLDPII